MSTENDNSNPPPPANHVPFHGAGHSSANAALNKILSGMIGNIISPSPSSIPSGFTDNEWAGNTPVLVNKVFEAATCMEVPGHFHATLEDVLMQVAEWVATEGSFKSFDMGKGIRIAIHGNHLGYRTPEGCNVMLTVVAEAQTILVQLSLDSKNAVEAAGLQIISPKGMNDGNTGSP